jgi:hypothetical protein
MAPIGLGGDEVMNVARINSTVDEALVGLGTIVLHLAHPAITRTASERQAHAKSVGQFAICAEKSTDPRVHELRTKLKETVKPALILVVNG